MVAVGAAATMRRRSSTGAAKKGTKRGSVGSDPKVSSRARELYMKNTGRDSTGRSKKEIEKEEKRSKQIAATRPGSGKGCCFGLLCKPAPVPELTGMAEQAADILGLSDRDIRRLRFHFDDIDIDGSGEIDYHEFFQFVDEPRSPMTDALFKLIDKTGRGVISWEDFVAVTITYCMYSRSEILKCT